MSDTPAVDRGDESTEGALRAALEEIAVDRGNPACWWCKRITEHDPRCPTEIARNAISAYQSTIHESSETRRLWDALVEIDTYLANDPDVWRIVNVAKAGDVLCDVLGAETIQAINATVQANLCAKCGEER